MRRSDAAALAALLLLFAVWFGGSVFGGQLLSMEDILGKFYGMRDQLHRTGLTLWNPLPGLGMPQLGIIENGSLAPISLLFYAFPTETVFRFYPTLVFTLAAWFTYGMLRTRDVEPMPALFGAVSWTTCGAVTLHVQHPPIMETLLWLPATLMCWNLWIRRGRGWTLAAAALTFTFQCLGGFPQYIVYDALVMAVWFAFDIWKAGPLARRRIAGALAVFVVGGLLTAWQMLPALELAKVSQRQFVDPATFADQFRAVSWEVAFDLASEAMWVVDVPPMTYGQGYPNRPCLSVVVTGLALLTLVWGVRGQRPWGAWAFVGLCLLGMLGRSGGVTPLLGALVPFVKQIRAPVRFIVPAALMVSWLGAVGLQALQERVKAPIAAFFVAYLVAAAWSFSHGDVRYQPAADFRPPEAIASARPRIALDIAHLEPENTPPYFYINAGLIAGVPTLVFVETLLPANYFEGMFASQWGPLDDPRNPRRIDILVSTFNKFPLLHPYRPILRAYGLATLLHWKGGALEAEALSPLPKWWVVPAQRTLRTPREREALAADDGWDPAVYAITEEAVPGVPAVAAGPASSPVQPMTVEPTHEVLTVDGAGGILVSSALMYPGWKVRVDDQPASPLQVDIALRGVVVAAGRHTVEWTYRPDWIPMANAATLLGLLGLIALAARGSVDLTDA